jgi:hypothetical protein
LRSRKIWCAENEKRYILRIKDNLVLRSENDNYLKKEIEWKKEEVVLKDTSSRMAKILSWWRSLTEFCYMKTNVFFRNTVQM